MPLIPINACKQKLDGIFGMIYNQIVFNNKIITYRGIFKSGIVRFL